MSSTTYEFLGDPALLEIVRNRSSGWEEACVQLGGYIELGQDDFQTPNCNLPAALGGFTYVSPSRDAFSDVVATGIAAFGGPVGKAIVAVTNLPYFRNPVAAPVHPSPQAIATARAKAARARQLALIKARMRLRRRPVVSRYPRFRAL